MKISSGSEDGDRSRKCRNSGKEAVITVTDIPCVLHDVYTVCFPFEVTWLKTILNYYSHYHQPTYQTMCSFYRLVAAFAYGRRCCTCFKSTCFCVACTLTDTHSCAQASHTHTFTLRYTLY